jgi:hypothetical protein
MEPSNELKELLLRFYQDFSAGDVALFERISSRQAGALSIGTDPTEWWEDYATLTQVARAQLREMRAAGIRLVPGEPQAYREGSVGWAADRPTFQLPDGTAWPLRLTLVFHQEQGEWKIVQSHASFGLPNEQLLGRPLPT